MKILIMGAGVIGAVYGWQLTEAGQDVTLYVRSGKTASYAQGIKIHCQDERKKSLPPSDIVFQPKFVESIPDQDDFDLILVAVKSNQLDPILKVLANYSGKADILFFQNNWWGDQKIQEYLPPERYFFGFSRIVGGWRKENAVHCIIFGAPGMSTMLGEKNGAASARVKAFSAILQSADLRPELSNDILSWLKFHYAEYLGATGAILKAGSAKAFADRKDLVRDAILATREALAVCCSCGAQMKAAPFNLKLYNLPLPLLTWIGQKQYQAQNIQDFFDENIQMGLDEINDQYQTVIQEGKRLNVPMPTLLGFEGVFARGT
jgi:ketopantoate reductase